MDHVRLYAVTLEQVYSLHKQRIHFEPAATDVPINFLHVYTSETSIVLVHCMKGMVAIHIPQGTSTRDTICNHYHNYSDYPHWYLLSIVPSTVAIVITG